MRASAIVAPRSASTPSDASIIALSPDGQSLAVGEGNNIRLINPNTGAAIKTLAGHKMPVSYVAFSPDNKQLLSGAADGNYHIWTIADGKFIAPKLELEKPSKITAVTWTTGGKLLVTAHEDNIIRSWDLATALTASKQLDAGFVQVNAGFTIQPNLSYGGFGRSGLGKEASLESMLEHFTRKKTVVLSMS